MKQWITAQVPEPRRFDFWREVVCQSFVPLRPERLENRLHVGEKTSPFNCALSVWEGRGLLFGRVSGTGQQVYRDEAGIRANDHPVYFLNIQKSGCGEIEQAGVTSVLEKCTFAIVDATQPFRMRLSDNFEQLSIKIPKAMLAPSLLKGLGFTARRVDAAHGVGKLAMNAFEVLAEEVDGLDSVSADFAIQQALALTACALNGASPDHHRHHLEIPSKLAQLRSRAMALIARSLDDPDLDVHQIALSLGVSARYVQLAFSTAQMSVGKWVLEQRLQRCRNDLLDARYSQLGVGVIAFRHGFSDLSHFNRAFKQRHGKAPGQFRKHAARTGFLR